MKNYSIHSLSADSTKLDDEKADDPSSNSCQEDPPNKEGESEDSTVETSPLIPEWANQTENPAFFQNLDIPTFLRRRGSNGPRQ